MREAEPIIATENSRHNYVYKEEGSARTSDIPEQHTGEPGRLCKFLLLYIEQQS